MMSIKFQRIEVMYYEKTNLGDICRGMYRSCVDARGVLGIKHETR